MIQISDLFGEYGVDFVMILVAAAVVDCGFRLRDRDFKQRAARYILAPVASCRDPVSPPRSSTATRSSALQLRKSSIINLRSTTSVSVRIALIQGNSARRLEG